MSDFQQFNSLNINFLQEPILQKVSEILDQTSNRGWRRLAELVANDRRFKLSSTELHQCSLKVLDSEGSPSRSLLRLMGDRGCTTKELTEFLQTLGQLDAAQFIRPQGIKVVVHPESIAVLSGQLVKLGCVASGHPLVNYQWFKMNKEVPQGNSSELVFHPVHVTDAGFYICRVNNGHSFAFSQWVQLDVCESKMTCHGLPENKLQICIHPQSQKLLIGDRLMLECTAIGKPIPRYQWYRNDVALRDATKKQYMISCVTEEHEGIYYCQVTNKNQSEDSMKVEVIVAEELSGFTVTEQVNQHFYATDKVALLIGNMSYKNHTPLKAPMVDVYELTNLLRQLNFKVVSLLDLTELEMRNAVNEFLLLLDKGVYGLFYYAGHGYENYGNSFMVPIDAPKPYSSSNCLCVQSILKLMQEKETGLNVFLLDMCRKRNQYDDTIVIPESLKVTANIVFGYATCQGAEAFEIQHSDLANGIFMKFLKKRLLEEKKITVLLDHVAEDMGRCQLTKGMQALEIRSSLSEKRALTDPIQQTACSPESLVRNLQWAKAHELPESMCIEFECGVKIQLGFAAEYSNVMIIYTTIIERPSNIIQCCANVTDFPVGLYVDPKEANKRTPEETGSFLVSKDFPNQCLYTRLSSLQTLKENLTFSVCLSYMYESIEETMDEKKRVDIGKPLIAKLDINSGFKRNFCVQTCHIPHSPEQEPAPRGPFHVCTSQALSPSRLDIYNPSVTSVRQSYQQDIYSSHDTKFFSQPKSTRNIPEEITDDNDEFNYTLYASASGFKTY
ncbi:mucosa-associated lymphoid tissue lymphoma translocation protein 1 isoform X2 [Bombina bombina]|uniref:mucosa-associated lymphoid tissue lymphoma translocation protein 1 isoform X2 n=1 Tax=Bombina bombina TaxID=8345 RepID=UPI00235A9FF9|nr:mucosa-associated lymphoid tissue lymphoma translocation protein 1 isoform X2 [Bombina bombina]